MTRLKACCQRLVAGYVTLYDPPCEGAALCCPECQARVVCHDGVWAYDA